MYYPILKSEALVFLQNFAKSQNCVFKATGSYDNFSRKALYAFYQVDTGNITTNSKTFWAIYHTFCAWGDAWDLKRDVIVGWDGNQ